MAIIPGLRIEELAGLWESVGMTCESRSGSFPDSPGGFNVHCEGMDVKANIDFGADAVYWTSDGIQVLSITITSITEDPIDGTSAAADVLIPAAELAGGSAARAWLQERIGDPMCAEECVEVIGGTQLALTVGSRGGYQLHVVAQS